MHVCRTNIEYVYEYFKKKKKSLSYGRVCIMGTITTVSSLETMPNGSNPFACIGFTLNGIQWKSHFNCVIFDIQHSSKPQLFAWLRSLWRQNESNRIFVSLVYFMKTGTIDIHYYLIVQRVNYFLSIFLKSSIFQLFKYFGLESLFFPSIELSETTTYQTKTRVKMVEGEF